jgi:hypothetical protein
MSARLMTLVLGTAAGAFLAAGLTSLATLPVAHADDDGNGITISPAADTGFEDHITTIGGITDIAAADPDTHFEAMVLEIPSLGITDVLTSGIDPTDSLATLVSGQPVDVTTGTVDITVNTFTDTMDPALDSSFTIPFTDPLWDIWVTFLPLGF